MARRERPRGDDSGAALVEFLGVTVMILVPVIYVVVAASQLQAAAFAVEGASRAAARGAVVAGLDALESGASPADARAASVARAEAAVAMALEDFAVRGDPTVGLACDSDPCFEPGSAITAEVRVDVPLAGVPGVVVEVVPLAVEVTAVGRSPVEGFAP
ncbi:pilus assembly protein [Demequina sp. SO4-13]|uniref:pilus assembly protein n=1 Tax=Demequina sp. SO4-13 TaxID=3401027 RepID=UPI003AF94C44